MNETLQNMFRNVTDQVSQLVGGYLPNLLGAVGILVIGWLVAVVVAAVVRGALKRTTIDNRLAAWMGASQDVEVERYAGKSAYWFIMLFVLVAFFQALNLTNVTEPLNVLLNQLTGFVPRLLGAGTLLLVAWLVATVVKKLIIGAMSAARVDERLSGEAEVEEGKTIPVSKALADGVYWLIFLLFLPAILGALALEGLLVPVQQLVDGLLGFLPNILAAGLILAVGWFVAHLVRRIVTNLLTTVGVDRLGDQIGTSQVLGTMRLSGLLGLITYVLILFPVLISSLNALQLAAITEPASDMLGTIHLDVIPSLFAAVLLVSVAYFVGRLVSRLIGNVLAGAGFDNILAQLGLGQPAEGGRTPSAMIGTLILVAIMLFASVEAASLLGFVNLAEMLSGFITLGGQVILGVVVFGIGLYLANLAATTVRASGSAQASLLANAARVAIIVLTGAMALRQMGLANEIINLAFGGLLVVPSPSRSRWLSASARATWRAGRSSAGPASWRADSRGRARSTRWGARTGSLGACAVRC